MNLTLKENAEKQVQLKEEIKIYKEKVNELDEEVDNKTCSINDNL